MIIWICIPVFNRKDFTLKCLISLKAQAYKNYRILICDHGSTDGTSEAVRQDFPEAVIIHAESSLWWTGAINKCIDFALKEAGSDDYILTLNNDTELPPDYLQEFASNSRKYPNSILTSVIYDIATNSLVSAGSRQNWLTARAKQVNFNEDALHGDSNVIAVSHASGRGTLFPVTVFRKLGLFDEARLPHYAADYDFTHKANRIGFPIYVCKQCRVLSHVNATGMTAVRDSFTLKGLVNYYTSIKSPANLKARLWYAWNNCPKPLLPSYLIMDFIRITGSYFRYFIKKA